MKLKGNSPILITLGLVVAAIIGVIVAWGRVREVKLPMDAVWRGPMLLCPGEGVRVEDVDQAVKWWADLGYDVERGCTGRGVTPDRSHVVSVELNPLLDTRGSVEDLGTSHGLTHTYVQEGQVLKAQIWLRPGVGALAIAHEIGHARGIVLGRHPAGLPSGHVLHPNRPGWDGRGL